MKRLTRAITGIAGLTLAGLALRRSGLREDLEWSEVTKPGTVIEIDGYGVHYIDAGEGPAIVLVHGFGGNTYNFRDQIPVLARRHRVVAVDLKGFGYSERDADAGLSATDQVRMLKRLVETLGIEQATFVGHSMGGGIVQRFAAVHPQTADALILAASVRANERPRMRMPRFLLRPLARVIARYVAPRMLKMAYAPGTQVDATVREETLRPTRLKGSVDGLLAMLRDGRRDAPVDVSAIRQPVLLLWGEEDRVVPLKVAQELRRDLPQARLVVIAGAGHMLFEERPRDCNEAIADFLKETVEAGSAAGSA
ncbi:MAG TPA: alpha/beta hydrolase [Dehalococcoidia bacterium]